jgi:hypothetical protein
MNSLEVKYVNRPLNMAFFLALLTLGGVPSAFPQSAEEPTSGRWVEFRNGQISLDFDQTPVHVALEKIRAKTGVDIVLPPAVQHEFLNLQMTGLPLEPAVRSLLHYIGFKSFVLMYDSERRPHRVVVLGTGRDNLATGSSEASNSPDTTAQQVTAEERDSLLQELESWSERNLDERSRLEERLKSLPPSETREQLVQEYGRQVLGLSK